jgi:hypothetical protein
VAKTGSTEQNVVAGDQRVEQHSSTDRDRPTALLTAGLAEEVAAWSSCRASKLAARKLLTARWICTDAVGARESNSSRHFAGHPRIEADGAGETVAVPGLIPRIRAPSANTDSVLTRTNACFLASKAENSTPAVSLCTSARAISSMTRSIPVGCEPARSTSPVTSNASRTAGWL